MDEEGAGHQNQSVEAERQESIVGPIQRPRSKSTSPTKMQKKKSELQAGPDKSKKAPFFDLSFFLEGGRTEGKLVPTKGGKDER